MLYAMLVKACFQYYDNSEDNGCALILFRDFPLVGGTVFENRAISALETSLRLIENS